MKGEEIVVKCFTFDSKGRGIAKLDNKIVFVEDAPLFRRIRAIVKEETDKYIIATYLTSAE